MEEIKQKILNTPRQWRTIASRIPLAKAGRFSILKEPVDSEKFPKRYYKSGDVFNLEEPSVTILYEGDRDPAADPDGVWMSDFPPDYFSMIELSRRARPGRVLVGGLGLGILQNFLAERVEISEVVVIEKAPEVIKLVQSFLQPKIKVVCGDFLLEVPRLQREGQKFQTVIADIFKSPSEEKLFQQTKSVMEQCYPQAKHLFWGFPNEPEPELSDDDWFAILEDVHEYGE